MHRTVSQKPVTDVQLEGGTKILLPKQNFMKFAFLHYQREYVAMQVPETCAMLSSVITFMNGRLEPVYNMKTPVLLSGTERN